MRRILVFFLLLGVFSFLGVAWGDEKPDEGAKPGKAPAGTVKEKARKEMGEVKKDAGKAGRDIVESGKALPKQMGREFKKTGDALKGAGKEIKENVKKSSEDVKKLMKKGFESPQ